MSEIVTPPVDPAPPADPAAPVDPAAPATPPAPAAPPAADEPTREELAAQLAAVQAQLAAADPILQAHTAAQEAEMSDAQKAQKAIARADAAEAREAALAVRLVAAQHGISQENIDLLGTGTLEQIEARAVRLAALSPAPIDPAAPVTPGAPPSQRPVEALKPGASPAAPTPVDDSYPASWLRPRRAN